MSDPVIKTPVKSALATIAALFSGKSAEQRDTDHHHARDDPEPPARKYTGKFEQDCKLQGTEKDGVTSFFHLH